MTQEPPKSLLEIRDTLSMAALLAEAAFMAAASLVCRREANAMTTVIEVMQDKLKEVQSGLEAISHGEKTA